MTNWHLLLRGLVTITLAAAAAACGSRAGNPKKPGTTTNAVAPTLTFGLAEGSDEPVTLPAGFPGGDDGNTSQSAVTIRLVKTVAMLNALNEKLTAEELPVGQAFSVATESGQLTGEVKQVAEDGFTYSSVFCQDGEPFYEMKWNDDSSRIYLQRDFRRYPFGTETGVEDEKTIVQLDLKKSATQPKELLEARFHVDPKRKDIFVQDADQLIDHFVYEGDGEKNVLARGQQFWTTKDETIPVQMTPQVHIAGRLDKSGAANVLFHHVGVTLFCPEALDYNKPDDPGWCLGLTLSPERQLGIMSADDIPVAWNGMKAIGLADHAQLKPLAMTATCPTP
jgi:hypothetical protein